ncbi:alpha/beta fold hydrolase [Kitasatospora sp. NPDC001175]|uniref:alpha/beta fold hydrolase n=1 Tax=Kitasatospora sp. NPDC001175 TaxID=3157103 RepID=UPI003D03E492
MQKVRIDGTDIAYEEAGSGETVVLVHAGCADRRMWQEQFAALSERYRVIRYDWRGRGASGDAVGSFAHHRDLLALMDRLQVRRAAVVGASDGGRIALDALLTAPHRFRALGLIAAGLSGHQWPASLVDRARRQVHSLVPSERLRHYQQGAAERIEPGDLDAVAEAEAELLVAGPDRTRAVLPPRVWELAVAMDRLTRERMWGGPRFTEQQLCPPAKERLAEVAVPTLVVAGLADAPEILAASALLAEGIPGARRLDLPDTGHLPPVERPQLVTAALTDFLATTMPW